jgi:hypothetical protein
MAASAIRRVSFQGPGGGSTIAANYNRNAPARHVKFIYIRILMIYRMFHGAASGRSQTDAGHLMPDKPTVSASAVFIQNQASGIQHLVSGVKYRLPLRGTGIFS